MKVELLKYPTEEDWMITKLCTLNTVGKTSTKLPTEEWKHKLIMSEHSPIRTLQFVIKMEIPYWISVHFCRHFIGVTHFVQSQRNDRQDKYDRETAPQGAMVSHMMYINAQELMFMARRRLCSQAAKETREVMQEICRLVEEKCPYMKGALEPMCSYRGGRCTEFSPCGYNKKYLSSVAPQEKQITPKIIKEELPHITCKDCDKEHICAGVEDAEKCYIFYSKADAERDMERIRKIRAKIKNIFKRR